MDTNQKNMSIPVVLKGTNYLLWSRTTKTALKSRGLWGYVDPKVEASDKGKAVEEGSKKEQEDQFVLAALRSSLEPAILAAYSYAETARELWETLLGVYGNMSNVSRIFEVKKALNEIQQRDRAFKDLFGEYRGLWAESGAS
ncbi:Retrovirus-related Pol polyprotein from transposon RE2 [Cardamine amara subsp. amara]|uniref:Retrovirus-related Pol polyprotein from transposon RE2 n=1 Tax=Cardamine amara subsp. amara TaxID=228776 RepID=A0ABD1AX86_CARAN